MKKSILEYESPGRGRPQPLFNYVESHFEKEEIAKVTFQVTKRDRETLKRVAKKYHNGNLADLIRAALNDYKPARSVAS